ncbi:MAG: MBL fold metallo-hydrolase [Candidatus Muiribacteriaceae bacterium]
MKITCYGARGSIPVSGEEYRKYGGNTTCIEVRGEQGTRLVIDAGTGIRQCGIDYIRQDVKDINILFTHYHLDHIMGLPFFKPLFYKDRSISIMGPRFENLSCQCVIDKIISSPSFPVMISEIKACRDLNISDIPVDPFNIGDFRISTINLNHPNGGVGIKIEEGAKKFVFLTDNELDYLHPDGHQPSEYIEFSKDADLLIHDAEFLENEYQYTIMWGHSTYTSAAKVAKNAGVKKFGLFHHNQNRSDSEIDNIIKKTYELTGNEKTIEIFGAAQGQQIII